MQSRRSDGRALSSAECNHVYYICALGSMGTNFVNFAEMEISWRPGGTQFSCVREGVSREQLVGNRLDKNDLPLTKADGSIDKGRKEEKQRMYRHVCFLFVDRGRLGPLTFVLCY